MIFNLADEAYIRYCPMEVLYHLAVKLNYVAGTQSLNNSLCSMNGTEKRAAAKGFKLFTTDSIRDLHPALPSWLSEEMKPL